DVKDGRVVKVVNFIGLQEVGDPVEVDQRYTGEDADELVSVDISEAQDGHNLMIDVIRDTAKELCSPLTVGSRISSVGYIRQLLAESAEKININSAALNDPELIKTASDKFGSQCICIAIDVRYDDAKADYFVFTHGGSRDTGIRALDWVE